MNVFDKGKHGVKLASMDDLNKVEQVRALKAQGYTYNEIADKLGMKSKQLANYFGRPRPGEHICPSCCRPLKKRK